MVLDEDLKPMHELTEKGKEDYSRLLESIADEILFRNKHPVKWTIEKIKEIFS